MNRRSFLIGAGSILTTAFVDKADWFLRNKNTVVPLIEPEKAADKIYFVKLDSEYELRLGSPEFDIPAMTNREALERYHGYDLSPNHPNTLSVFRDIYQNHRVRPSDLDGSAIYDNCFVESWARTDSNNARAYHFLEDLDLFGSDNAAGLRRGDLRFVDGYSPANSYLGVTSHDPVSASLLQARLLELGKNVSVEIVG